MGPVQPSAPSNEGSPIVINPLHIDRKRSLLTAAKNGDVEGTKTLLAQDGIDVNCQGNDGRTLLSMAADNGHAEVVQMLLVQDGIDINCQDSHGRTPLSKAAENGH